MSVDPLADLRDTADALTEPHQHREPLHTWEGRTKKITGHHTVILPGLLQQLADIAIPGSAEGEAGRPAPASRPPLQLQAISAWAAINIAVVRWCWSLRLNLRDTVESNVRMLLGAAGTQDRDTQLAMLGEMRTWRRQCEVITGWRTPDPQVQAPCPHCGARQLRVNLADRSARCDGCGARWDDDGAEVGQIGVLAQHISRYMAQSKAAADRARADERAAKARRSGRSAA